MQEKTNALRSARGLRFALGITLVAAIGCHGTGSGEAESETLAETTGSSNGMSSTSLSTETTGQTGGATTEGTTEGTTDTTEGTTGEGPSLEEACLAGCKNTEGCVPNPFPDFESCLWFCNRDDGSSSACTQGLIDYQLCVSQMTCAEYGDSLMGEPNPCNELGQAIGELCDICPLSILSGDSCAMARACEGQAKIEYSCAGDTCTCLVDDEPQAECPARGVCSSDFGAQAAAAEACCGFEF